MNRVFIRLVIPALISVFLLIFASSAKAIGPTTTFNDFLKILQKSGCISFQVRLDQQTCNLKISVNPSCNLSLAQVFQETGQKLVDFEQVAKASTGVQPQRIDQEGMVIFNVPFDFCRTPPGSDGILNRDDI
jgi:hypothetical protein